MKLQRLIASIAVSLMAIAVTVVALASPAAAASGNGAQHFEYANCYTDPYYNYTYCSSEKTLYNVTENKNNYSVVWHSDSSYSYTDPTCSYSGQSTSKQNYLFKKSSDTTQVNHFSSSGSSIFQCGGISEECTFTNHYQFANGQVRHEDSEYSCTPV